jgi:probable HAF family extracellular repeat protein
MRAATSAFIVPLTAATIAWGAQVTPIDIGPFPGAFDTAPRAFNNRGDIVGDVTHPEGSFAFLWTREHGYRRITFGLASRGIDVNERRQVIGAADREDGTHGFLWSERDGLVDLGGCFPLDINDRGVVLCEVFGGPPMFYSDGVFTTLPLPSEAVPNRLNNRKEVVGLLRDRSPFIWSEARGIVALPGSGVFQGNGHQINDAGLVLGDERFFAPGDATRSAVWLTRAGVRKLIPFPEATDGKSLAVNNRGMTLTEVFGIPMIWNLETRTGTELCASGRCLVPDTDLLFAKDLNDNGQVLMWAVGRNGTRPVILAAPTSLRVDSPNTRARWGINTRQRLAWTYDGDAPQLRIEISRDGGDTWDFVRVVPRQSTSQNFLWRVTGPNTSAARLRVTAVNDERASDVNDADIRIAPPVIEFVRPHRRSAVRFGTKLRLFWKHNLGARVPVAIDVSQDGGNSWRPVTAHAESKGSTTSTFGWFVDLPVTSRARLRIRALDGSGATGTSEVFAVSALQ